MEDKPTFDQDTGTQVLTAIEETLQSTAENAEPTEQLSDDDVSNCQGTNQDDL